MAGFLSYHIGIRKTQITFGIGCITTATAMFVAYPQLHRIN